MTVSSQRLKELEAAERKLNALEQAGVDNWDGYDFAMEIIKHYEEVEELKRQFLENLYDILAEAEVDHPAGYNCGHRITLDEHQENRIKEWLVEYTDKCNRILGVIG